MRISFYLNKTVESSNGIKLLSRKSIVKKLISKPSLTTFINPYSIKVLTENNKLNVLNKYDNIFVDGISLVITIYLITKIKIPRLSFDMTSLAPHLFAHVTETNQSLYLIGSKKEDITLAVKNIRNRYTKINILGYSPGYFRNTLERESVLKEIVKLSPEIVIVGMGTPTQECFLLDLRKNGWIGNGFTCGAFFEQTAKDIYYYPNFFDKYNLRWLFRLSKNWRLFKRYFYDYPIQIAKLFIQKEKQEPK